MMKQMCVRTNVLDGDQSTSLFSVFFINVSIDYNFYYGQKLRYMVPQVATYENFVMDNSTTETVRGGVRALPCV